MVVQCLDRGGRAGMVEGVGVLYEIALWIHAGNILSHTFRKSLKCVSDAVRGTSFHTFLSVTSTLTFN